MRPQRYSLWGRFFVGAHTLGAMQIRFAAVLMALCATVAPHARIAVDTYTVTASVSEGRGETVTGLTPADFEVRLGDTVQPVTAVAVDPRPVAMVIMVDGMESSEALQMRATLTGVMKRLRGTPGTRVGLMLGERGATAPKMVDAIEGADELNRRISRFFRAEVTAPPQDLLAGAAEALSREETHRRVAVVLSVNRRTDRVPIPLTLIPALRNANVTLVALEANGIRGNNPDPALRLIQTTVGGRFEQVSDVTAFESSALRVVSTLLSAYQVQFTLTEPANGGLDVAVRNRPRATVIAPAWASGRGSSSPRPTVGQ